MATATIEDNVCVISGDTTAVPPGSALTVNVGGRVFHGGTVAGDFTYRAAIPLADDFPRGMIEVRLADKRNPRLLDWVEVGDQAQEPDDEPLEQEAERPAEEGAEVPAEEPDGEPGENPVEEQAQGTPAEDA